MELQTGVCGICSAKNLLLSSEDSGKYCDIVFSLFENEFNISKVRVLIILRLRTFRLNSVVIERCNGIKLVLPLFLLSWHQREK